MTTSRPPFLSGRRPRVIAHRGFAPGGEGNTLESFERALAAGADLLETDVRASLDGVAVLVHDEEVADERGVRHRIETTRWEELADLVLPSGERLLPLAEALRLLPHARFNIDVKARTAVVPVVEAVRAAGARDRVLITSFSESRRRAAVRRLPGVATSASAPRFVAALVGAHLGSPALVRRALRGIDALQVPERAAGLQVTAPRILARLRTTGAEIHLWTINDPRRMRALLDLGVDGLVTDRTDLARLAVDGIPDRGDDCPERTGKAPLT
ncbi:glycerophosphoryl diester phosphodiesterase [Rathayibacter sp. PhB93]|jgi:glycerophosphoryl diester phosphodiesterase|uniref:glycerophosphodiester phosphodiesterase family protein n=1 Tax=unclassified Rathayibacter TaxID=2609250 RepID=UPI000F4847A4|nr:MULTISPECIES: glycerophosphodiester phosphodiesterase family protein [unclassified Rathayibacter]ROQ05506.1 glycerophosphoryl diester phosphodiesterase [Rathayibacter sp. PhB93]TDQ12423.1 glycerophosphoryl diester phosphodiesterase [Rathayibacter sp. PhB1]